MPTYFSLIKYTQQGAANIKEGPERLDAVRAAARAMGGEIREWYLTMGRYDAVAYLLLAIGVRAISRPKHSVPLQKKLIANLP